MTTRELVGREAEVETLARLVDEAAGGPRALLLTGEAGIGKTLLWQYGVAIARERLCWVLSARAVEAEAKLGFTGLGDLLETVPADAMAELPSPQRRALDIALLRADAKERSVDKRAVSVAFLSVLRALAASAPVVIAVDDVPWLDAATARALQFALRRIEHEPVAMLATARSPAGLGLEDALAVDVVEVKPLEIEDVHVLVKARLGMNLPPPRLRKLHRLSGGNPFFALELAREGGLDLDDARGLPTSLGAAVAERLAALPPRTRASLAAAAALARPTVSLVAAALGRSDGRAPALAPAVKQAIVVIEGEDVRFTHPLLASAAYAASKHRDRRLLHARLAAAVDDPEESAKHLAAATDAPDETVAEALEAAARRSRARGAADDAAELAEHAARLTSPDTETYWQRAVDAALYHAWAGDPHRARQLLAAVIEDAPRGAARARALHHRAGGSLEPDPETAIALQEQALREAEEDLPLSAAIHLALGRWRALWNLEDGLRHASAAVAIAERTGDDALAAAALAAAAELEFYAGCGISYAAFERAVSLDPAVPETPRVWARPAITFANVLVAAGELDRARALYRQELERAHRRMDELLPAWVEKFLGDVEFAAGAYDAAGAHYADAERLALQTEQLHVIGHLSWRLAWLDAVRGNVDGARRRAEEVVTAAAHEARTGALDVKTVAANTALAFVDLSLGDPAAAAERLAPLAPRMVAAGAGDPVFFAFVPDQVEALVALGEVEEARSLTQEHEARARAVDRPLACATAARCRALVDAAEGDFEAALEAVEQALRDHERMLMPFERARTLLVKGMVERRAKQRRAARESLEEALAEFERLGTPLWADRARAELRRIGGRPARGYELTPTEERVASLVADGKTNREVAQTLFMSVKTVEANLSRIYGKLGVRSRTELASRFATEGRAAGKT